MITTKVILESLPTEEHRFRLQLGTDLGFTPRSQPKTFGELSILRDQLLAVDAAPRATPFPSQPTTGSGDQDAAALELWLNASLTRWWQLPQQAKSSLVAALGLEESRSSQGSVDYQRAPSPRLRMFSIDAERDGCGAESSSLRSPLLF